MGGEAGEEGPREREGRLGRGDCWGGGAVGGEAGEEGPLERRSRGRRGWGGGAVGGEAREEGPRQPEDLRRPRGLGTDGWGAGSPTRGGAGRACGGGAVGLSRGGVVP